jgi:hypothetical protein
MGPVTQPREGLHPAAGGMLIRHFILLVLFFVPGNRGYDIITGTEFLRESSIIISLNEEYVSQCHPSRGNLGCKSGETAKKILSWPWQQSSIPQKNSHILLFRKHEGIAIHFYYVEHQGITSKLFSVLITGLSTVLTYLTHIRGLMLFLRGTIPAFESSNEYTMPVVKIYRLV